MIIRMITGATRVCGKAQGFLGLPIRDVMLDDKVVGRTAAMQTAWEPTPDELAQLNAGGSIVVTILGVTPAPMMLAVEATSAVSTLQAEDNAFAAYERAFDSCKAHGGATRADGSCVVCNAPDDAPCRKFEANGLPKVPS